VIANVGVDLRTPGAWLDPHKEGKNPAGKEMFGVEGGFKSARPEGVFPRRL